MEQVIDLMRRSVDLAGTVKEALEHILVQLDKGRLEQSIVLFADGLSGIIEIEKCTKIYAEQLPEHRMSADFAALKEALAKAASAYESTNTDKVIQTMENVMSAFCTWEAELQRCCHPFILS